MIATVVDWGALWQVIWVSALAASVLTAAFSLGILGAARAATARREGDSMAATLYGALALLAAGGVTAAVVLAVSVMLSKG